LEVSRKPTTAATPILSLEGALASHSAQDAEQTIDSANTEREGTLLWNGSKNDAD
jgi:hypothetical protein